MANQQSTQVTVLLALGDGGFGLPLTATAFSATAVAFGDFNEDGRMDVAVADNSSVTSIDVLLGNGDGTLQPVYIAGYTSGFINNVATADLNGDGHLDLASAVNDLMSGTQAGSVKVLLGFGDGGFQAPLSYDSAGADPMAIAIADFSGDGLLDIAVMHAGASSSGAGVGLLTGLPDGGFNQAVLSPISTFGSQPMSGAAGDFNGDGVSDLAVAMFAGSVLVYLGGDGGLTPTNQSLSAGLPSAIVAGDFDGDGLLDLATADNFAGVRLLSGLGNGTFQAPSAPFAAGIVPEALAVGAFGGDGAADLAVADRGSFGSQADAGVTIILGKHCP